MSIDKPIEGECDGCKELNQALMSLRDRLWSLEDAVKALQAQVDRMAFETKE